MFVGYVDGRKVTYPTKCHNEGDEKPYTGHRCHPESLPSYRRARCFGQGFLIQSRHGVHWERIQVRQNLQALGEEFAGCRLQPAPTYPLHLQCVRFPIFWVRKFPHRPAWKRSSVEPIFAEEAASAAPMLEPAGFVGAGFGNFISPSFEEAEVCDPRRTRRTPRWMYVRALGVLRGLPIAQGRENGCRIEPDRHPRGAVVLAAKTGKNRNFEIGL